MPAYVTIPDFIKIGVMALVFIWLVNMGLRKMGLENLAA